MNPRRGWNLDLEESDLPKYRKYEAEIFTPSIPGIYLWPVNISTHEPSPNPRYIKCTKTY